MQNNFMNPNMMGLLGLAQGMLQSSGSSPREITFGEAMGNGLQSGMQGYQQGLGMQMQNQHLKMLEEEGIMKKNKLARQLEMEDQLRRLSGEHGAGDPVTMGQRLIGSGNPELMKLGATLMKSKTAKSFIKGKDDKGNPTYFTGYSTGEVSPTGVAPAEKLAFQNLGNQTVALDPYTGQPITSYAQGITPGQSASLAQSRDQFAQSHGLDLMKTRNMLQQARQPQYKDGYWVTPPTADNPEGTMTPTSLATAPKGSMMASKVSAAKTQSLLDEATGHIRGATGSYGGALLDEAAKVVGVSTGGAKSIASLKAIETGLVMNMPRLEGPQSNYDQQLYREAAGNIGDPTIPRETKLAAIKTIKTIQGRYPDAFGNLPSTNAPSANTPTKSNDGWGDLR